MFSHDNLVKWHSWLSVPAPPASQVNLEYSLAVYQTAYLCLFMLCVFTFLLSPHCGTLSLPPMNTTSSTQTQNPTLLRCVIIASTFAYTCTGMSTLSCDEYRCQNVLSTCTLLITDSFFPISLSSPAPPGEIYTDYVATRWYRAPELLVGDTSYGRYIYMYMYCCIISCSDGVHAVQWMQQRCVIAVNSCFQHFNSVLVRNYMYMTRENNIHTPYLPYASSKYR